ncbi:hypothetical protein QQ045_032468 [Rhodiola kirilowii]
MATVATQFSSDLFEFNVDDKKAKQVLFDFCAQNYPNWMFRVREILFTPFKTLAERMKMVPEHMEPSDWMSLISYWSSDDFQKKSSRNKLNRSKKLNRRLKENKIIPWICGSKIIRRKILPLSTNATKIYMKKCKVRRQKLLHKVCHLLMKIYDLEKCVDLQNLERLSDMVAGFDLLWYFFHLKVKLVKH